MIKVDPTTQETSKDGNSPSLPQRSAKDMLSFCIELGRDCDVDNLPTICNPVHMRGDSGITNRS